VNLSSARARVGAACALQGNLDPMCLMAPPEAVAAQARAVLDAYGAPDTHSGHVFNLGHGISQFTPPDHVAVLVETVHRHSRSLRKR
jgi:uroporphyrinogen decarboxylase